ncbi:MAG: hydantoinase B/oxoprolinase family protein, partial [Mariprofundaceae bacterium]
RAGQEQADWRRHFESGVRLPDERLGDLAAQKAAVLLGARRLGAWPAAELAAAFAALRESGRAWGERTVEGLPDGEWRFEDAMEDDGLGAGPLPVRVRLRIEGARADVDFTGTAAQTPGPLNCPLPVTAAAVWYVFRCLMPSHAPGCASVFEPIHIHAPEGSLVNARPGAAVAAGNVETSQRIVDAVLGALAQACPQRVAAASQGTMNNVVFAGRGWSYYETLGGGMGAHAAGPGLSAVQCHMTNTKNTSIEVLEMHYPLRVRRYGIRAGSGGAGRHAGGDGLIREWEALADCEAALLAERRASRPWGLAGGGAGEPGVHRLWRAGVWQELPAKTHLRLRAGDRLWVETPGGGGFGERGEAEDAC